MGGVIAHRSVEDPTEVEAVEADDEQRGRDERVGEDLRDPGWAKMRWRLSWRPGAFTLVFLTDMICVL